MGQKVQTDQLLSTWTVAEPISGTLDDIEVFSGYDRCKTLRKLKVDFPGVLVSSEYL